MPGAMVLFLGPAAGLYFLGVAMVAIFFFTISGAWLLRIGISGEEAWRLLVFPILG